MHATQYQCAPDVIDDIDINPSCLKDVRQGRSSQLEALFKAEKGPLQLFCPIGRDLHQVIAKQHFDSSSEHRGSVNADPVRMKKSAERCVEIRANEAMIKKSPLFYRLFICDVCDLP